MKTANARIAFYAWIMSGGLMFGALGWSAFFTPQALVFFTVGAVCSVYVIGYANFLLQRGVALALQFAIGQPSSWGARFINGFGVGLLSGAAALSWVAARITTNILFGLP